MEQSVLAMYTTPGAMQQSQRITAPEQIATQAKTHFVTEDITMIKI